MATRIRNAERNDALLTALVEAAADGIIAIDSQGEIISFNPAACRLFGYTGAEARGQNVKLLMPAPVATEHDLFLEQYLQTGHRHIIGIGREVEGRRKDGSFFPMHLSVGEARVGSERFFIGIVRDISAQRDAARANARLITELEGKNSELERFSYTVSHDLKSPLITIRGFSDLLIDDCKAGDTARLQEDINRIKSAAAKMEQLLDELLELSRAGRVIRPPETFELKEVAGEVLSLLSGALAGTDVRLQEPLPELYGDRLRLREVLQNLLENAAKFMGEQQEPQIVVGGTTDASSVTVSVRDNGVGIDPRFLERIFDLFEQLNPQGPGTGVGLAMVKRVIETHGGRVWAESGGKGQGATFFFSLPHKPELGGARP